MPFDFSELPALLRPAVRCQTESLQHGADAATCDFCTLFRFFEMTVGLGRGRSCVAEASSRRQHSPLIAASQPVVLLYMSCKRA
jgi:hypothetical protein